MSNSKSTDGHEMDFQRLIHTNFDPIQYLNESLPALTLSSQTVAVSKQSKAASLQNASTETQTLLAQLNAHNIRSSSELTLLTDGILRSANRLAYEVEILRGDANNLYDILTDNLKDEIAEFVSGEAATASKEETHPSQYASNDMAAQEDSQSAQFEPGFIRQLHLLGILKSRLETVVSIFGEAMKWPIATSEVTGTSSLISVAAPELGVVTTAEDDQAREYTRLLRYDITELLDSDGGGQAGLEAAIRKVNDLKKLVEVWRDTLEEKARIRMVEGLSKLVADKKKVLDSRAASIRQNANGSTNRSSSMQGRAGRIVEGSTNTAAGLFRKLRDEMYSSDQ